MLTTSKISIQFRRWDRYYHHSIMLRSSVRTPAECFRYGPYKIFSTLMSSSSFCAVCFASSSLRCLSSSALLFSSFSFSFAFFSRSSIAFFSRSSFAFFSRSSIAFFSRSSRSSCSASSLSI